ncbi:hypothetical protein RQCS_28430 [Rhodococcus qingshengii]|uniref:DUF3500 domain-containing protein n=1 Tax=Rhodococcus qingshengii TaxID=334542 RepID=UPI000A6EAD45|nr:DUF3500 domain-containing protein [Rhodococcus qingshengii]BCF83298.1 hypothetical protein RQCS_28430 [Rhodococcus qingshengii]
MSTPNTNDTTGTHWRGSEEAPPQAAPQGYGGFAPRPPGLFSIKGGIVDVSTLPPPLQHVFEEFEDNLREPFVGLTSDGLVIDGLYPLTDTGLSTEPVAIAARRFLELLDHETRAGAVLPIDSTAWRGWINAFAPRTPHGTLLDDLTQEQRDAAMAVFAAALSTRGFEQLRTNMRINAALGEIAPGYEDTLREYMYWFTIFGEPSTERPWGFQLYGHHACVNVFIVGSQLTVGPMFLGAEPRVVEGGEHAGLRAFDSELTLALQVLHSLTSEQRAEAVLSDSVKWADLPPELAHPTEGRMRGSVARDNAVVPLDGISAADLDSGQRRLLRDLIEHFVGRLPDEHAQLAMSQIDAHFDETNFSWAGVPDIAEPFYYKVQSPVIFIETDAHSGIFLSNDEPQSFHIHNVVRIPNGNDYGRAWLRQYQERL